MGVQELDDIKATETEERVSKEFRRRVRKVLETKLNGNNIVKEINTSAVPVVRYMHPMKWYNHVPESVVENDTCKVF